MPFASSRAPFFFFFSFRCLVFRQHFPLFQATYLVRWPLKNVSFALVMRKKREERVLASLTAGEAAHFFPLKFSLLDGEQKRERESERKTFFFLFVTSFFSSVFLFFAISPAFKGLVRERASKAREREIVCFSVALERKREVRRGNNTKGERLFFCFPPSHLRPASTTTSMLQCFPFYSSLALRLSLTSDSFPSHTQASQSHRRLQIEKDLKERGASSARNPPCILFFFFFSVGHSTATLGLCSLFFFFFQPRRPLLLASSSSCS